MTHKQIATYLNNHLAGSTTILQLLAQLETTHTGTDLAQFFATLRADVLAERRELESLMQRLNITENPLRQAAAWLAEKLTQLKLRLDSPADEALRLLEALELVAVGIEGKRALWRSLAVASEDVPELQGVDYEHLLQRSEEQQRRVETVRLEAAKAAFVAGA